jgi:heme o synthase
LLQGTKILGQLKAVSELIKYRLSAAVTFSAVTGYLIHKPSPDFDLLLLIAGLFLIASGSAALNQVTEKEYDAVMVRTRNRPVPGKRMKSSMALLISVLLLTTGMLILLPTGIRPVLLGLFNIVLYNLVYTRLKRITPLALIPGSLVGAIPPLIGFAASGGNMPDAGILLFSTFMFLWQIPHFLLICIRYSVEYKAAGFKFSHFPEYFGNPRIMVFLWIVFSTAVLIGFSITELLFQRILFFIIIPLNLVFILLFFSFLFSIESERNSRTAFILVNSFSFIIMLFFIINSLISAA